MIASQASNRPMGVLGAGSWGTALAVHAARVSDGAQLWARSAEDVARMRSTRRNKYLGDAELPTELEYTSEMSDLSGCSELIVAVPSQVFRSVLREFLQVSVQPELTVISGTKGIETDTLARMSEVTFEEGARANRDVHFAVLSGPSFSDELVAGTPTASVIASTDVDVAAGLQGKLTGHNLRLYASSDVVGVEIGGTAKNVVAIAAGVVHGLGMGHNTLAALMTRGLHEITRLGLSCGGRPRTFSGLAGMGDLVLTCTGGQSRNRRTGELLAEGLALPEIEAQIGMVAEGVKNAVALKRLAERRRIEMPITQMMSRVLYDGKPAREAVEELMDRDLKMESEL